MSGLSQRLETLAADAASRPKALLLLDYDGTLVPIRSRPGLARLRAEQRRTLARFHGPRLGLAVISGRGLANLRRRVDIPHAAYGGVFGLELALPGWHYLHPRARALRPAVEGLIALLQRLFKDVPGVLVEDKHAGLTLHYRAVPASALGAFRSRARQARAQAPKGLLWRHGKLAWEIAPRAAWNKGKAARVLWRRLGKPYLLAIGDDPYDEPMLRFAQSRGAAIRVGSGGSRARYRLEGPEDVHRFLRSLARRAALSR